MIELEQIHKVYHVGEVDVPALQDVSLSVARGEFLAITGASGCGKSTLLNLLGCLDQPTAGRYRLDGAEVSGLSWSELARVRNSRIGFVFQSFNLLMRQSALENVELPLVYGPPIPAPERRGRALELLARVGLADRVHHTPVQLSGGQQQRVAIARALVNRPALILADEPTGNLDSHSGHDIMTLFHELHAQGLTIIAVTHSDEIAQAAQRIIRMQDGRIL
ncbi:MAG: ABC transporter ATP-binding protein [Lentisphaerae bacterium]|nr:ABC transporter ATP-binding protein [Lentisphaerota bacterium]